MRTRTTRRLLALLFAIFVFAPQAILIVEFHKLRGELVRVDPSHLIPWWVSMGWVSALFIQFAAIWFLISLAIQAYEDWLARQLANFWESIKPKVPNVLKDESALHGFLFRLHDRISTEQANHQLDLVNAKARSEGLLRMQAESVAVDRLATVGRLAAGVAHEIGNPLSGIMGYISILRSLVKGNPEALEVLDGLNTEIQRIDSTVRSLLDVGRPSRGTSQPVDLRATIDAAVRLVAAGRHSDVRFVVDAPESLWVLAEGGPLAQALINVLLNAVQAAQGGTIRVSATVEGERALLRVEDEGPGISEEVAPRLFEPFFTTRSPGQGTGLGLPMTRHLLSQFGSTISGANRPEKGAVFTITLLLPPAV